MFRCYFTRNGHASAGCYLKVETLDAAIATGQKILNDEFDSDTFDGLEIWLDRALLYQFRM